jgi:hypothetical protein
MTCGRILSLGSGRFFVCWREENRAGVMESLRDVAGRIP